MDKNETPPLMQSVYQFCPRCGTKNQAVGKIPFQCESCDLSLYFGPVSAVAGLILNQDDQLLMVRRARSPGLGKWGLPGGFVDQGESGEQALSREIKEETGLTMTSATVMMTAPNRYEHNGVTACVLDLFYVCEVKSYDKIQLAEAELDAYDWSVPDTERLDQMAFVSNRQAVEQWLAVRQR